MRPVNGVERDESRSALHDVSSRNLWLLALELTDDLQQWSLITSWSSVRLA